MTGKYEFKAKQTKLGWVGYVKVKLENGKTLYSKSAGINRLTVKDALMDARELYNDLLEMSGLPRLEVSA